MTIVFIDDDPDDTELFSEAITYIKNSELFVTYAKGGIECVTLNDSCKAIELLNTLESSPEFIFLDINMPVMDGKKCLKYLKSQPRFSSIPVIMLSTAFSSNQLSDFKALGAADLIKKPSGFNDLVKILSKFIYNKCLV